MLSKDQRSEIAEGTAEGLSLRGNGHVDPDVCAETLGNAKGPFEHLFLPESRPASEP